MRDGNRSPLSARHRQTACRQLASVSPPSATPDPKSDAKPEQHSYLPPDAVLIFAQAWQPEHSASCRQILLFLPSLVSIHEASSAIRREKVKGERNSPPFTGFARLSE